jgi:probable O-glycosylation ligase (exosortase A-associated)
MIFVGLLAFFVLEYIRPATFIPALGVLKLNTIVPLGVGACNLLSGGRIANPEAFRESNTKILSLFLALIVISVVMADVSEYAFIKMQGVIGYLLIFWVIVRRVDSVARFKAAFATLIVVHITLAALTPEMFTDTGARHFLASGTFLSDGNDFALSVNLCIPLCLFLMFDAKRKPAKILYSLVLVFLVACVVLTQSRGGTIALACVGLYYWLKSDRKVVLGFLAIIVVVGIGILAPAAYFDRMNTISPDEGSAQGRISAWKAGIRMALGNPLFGVGAGNFPFAYGAYRVGDDGGPGVKTAHSIYFLILGELGFPGLGVLLYFIFRNLTVNRKLIRDVKSRGAPDARSHSHLLAAVSASLIAYATAGAFLSQLYSPHWYVLAGFLTAAQRLVGRGSPSTASPAQKPDSTDLVRLRRDQLTARPGTTGRVTARRQRDHPTAARPPRRCIVEVAKAQEAFA